MATFSLNKDNKNFVRYLLLCFLLIIIFPNSCFSEIFISKIKNKIYVLNLYGKRFFLDEVSKIRSGDYLSTKAEPATIILNDNTKICFSSNSSLKVLKNKNRVNLEFKKGLIFLSINEASQDVYNLYFVSYNLDHIRDIIILSKRNNVIIINFKKDLNIFYKNDIKKINLPSFTILELSNNGKVVRKTKSLETNISKNFLEYCDIKLTKIDISENEKFKLKYGCTSRNGKLVCSNKYK